jgi:hypothetical protein
MAQGTLGNVVGQRQLGMIEHDPEGVPIVEQLAGEGTGFLVLGLGMAQAQREQGVELVGVLGAQRHRRGTFPGGVHRLHHRLETTAQGVTEIPGLTLQTLLQAAGFAYQMGQAAQAVVVVAVGPVAAGRRIKAGLIGGSPRQVAYSCARRVLCVVSRYVPWPP